MICNCHDFQSLHYCCYEQIELCFVSQGRVTTAVRRGGQLCCSFVANVLKYLCAKTHTLTAALDQLRVVASSTSNDPGPRSRQHQCAKNYENIMRFDKVISKIIRVHFFASQWETKFQLILQF